MTFRFSKTLSPLLVLASGLGVATTAHARDDESSSSDDKASSTKQSSKEAKGDVDADGWRDTTPKKATKKSAKAEVSADSTANASNMKGSVALLGSYGPSSDHTQGGLGLRGGLHFDALYVGLLATYFFSHEQSSPAQLGQGPSTTTAGFMYLGGEAGIDLDVITDVSMRPYIGLGVGRASYESCGGVSGSSCSTDAKYPLTITPGVLGLYHLGSSLFVGADVRFLIAAGANDVSGPILSATLGFGF